MIDSSPEIDATLARSPFAEIGESIIANHGELEKWETEAERIQSERQAAIDAATKAAAEPFIEPLEEANSHLSNLKGELDPDKLGQKLREVELAPMALTALDIILRCDQLSTDKFAAGLVDRTLSKDTRNANNAYRALGSFMSFENFRSTVENLDGKTLPVAAIHLDWFEQIDIQAQHEGRDYHTGDFVKECELYLGSVTESDLVTLTRDIAPAGSLTPIYQPQAVGLNLAQALHIQTKEKWNQLESEAIQNLPEPVIVPLLKDQIGKPILAKQNRSLGGSVNWAKSQALDFSMVRPGLHGVGHQIRADARLFLVWGDDTEKALNVLKDDEAIPFTTGQAIKVALEVLHDRKGQESVS